MYLAGWIVVCVAAAIVAARTIRPNWRDVGAFLRVPWRIAVFTPAILFVTFAGRFTDDETWDVVTGGGMSIFTFLTSWWAIGTMVRVFRRMAKPREMFVAIAVWLFSSSWFYDGYLLLRDGAYTQRWLGNLLLSPTIYLCAGLLLNLEAHDGKMSFAFARKEWPRPLPNASKVTIGMVLAGIPLVAIAIWFLVGAVGWSLQAK